VRLLWEVLIQHAHDYWHEKKENVDLIVAEEKEGGCERLRDWEKKLIGDMEQLITFDDQKRDDVKMDDEMDDEMDDRSERDFCGVASFCVVCDSFECRRPRKHIANFALRRFCTHDRCHLRSDHYQMHCAVFEEKDMKVFRHTCEFCANVEFELLDSNMGFVPGLFGRHPT